MKAEMTTTNIVNIKVIGANLLVLAAAVVVVSIFTGKKLPFLQDDRSALIALAVMGFLACAVGMTINGRPNINWLHPLTILSAVLGTAALLVIVLGLMGKPIPFLPGANSAFNSLAVIIALKWAATWLHTFLGS